MEKQRDYAFKCHWCKKDTSEDSCALIIDEGDRKEKAFCTTHCWVEWRDDTTNPNAYDMSRYMGQSYIVKFPQGVRKKQELF